MAAKAVRQMGLQARLHGIEFGHQEVKREWRDDQSDAGRPGIQVLQVHVFSVGKAVIG